jgi:hypothetical protein
MFLSSCVLFLLLTYIVPNKSDYALQCPNGRQALWTFDVNTLRMSTGCSTPRQLCNNKIGICTDQNLCCPRALK